MRCQLNAGILSALSLAVNVRRYEINQDCKRAVRFIDETTLEVDGHHGAKQFVFDSVFSEENGQADIFEDTRNLVLSALDG